MLTCNPNYVASRNQDIYTSRVAPGLVVLAPGNQKTLGNVPNTSTLLQRAFPVVVQNTTNVLKTFRLTIANQPQLANGSNDPKGQATFQQIPATPTVTTLDVQVNPLSSISRSVFVKSANPTASVTVNVQEISGVGGNPVTGGLTGTTLINPDPTAPGIINPDNPAVGNPAVSNAEVYNPAVGNPAVGNPAVGNPAVSNPAVSNPAVSNPAVGNPAVSNQAVSAALNPAVGNPAVSNPAVGNPAVSNPAVSNLSVTDASYELTNTGNTVATYSIKLFGPNLPTSLLYQLIVNKLYYLNTPGGADGCTLQVQPTNVILSNIPNPTIVTDPGTLANPAVSNPAVSNATVAVPPGETVQITLRISPGSDQNGNPLPPLTPDQVQQQVLNNVTPVVVSHAVNTQNLGQTNPQPPISLTITTKALPNANLNVAYSQQVAAIGGVINPPTTNYTWSLFSGNLPPGLSITTSGSQHLAQSRTHQRHAYGGRHLQLCCASSGRRHAHGAHRAAGAEHHGDRPAGAERRSLDTRRNGRPAVRRESGCLRERRYAAIYLEHQPGGGAIRYRVVVELLYRPDHGNSHRRRHHKFHGDCEGFVASAADGAAGIDDPDGAGIDVDHSCTRTA